MDELDEPRTSDRTFGLKVTEYRGLKMVVAPASSDAEVSVWWPHPDAMRSVTRCYVDAAATRVLHAVFLAQATEVDE
jgi:hypothetical protein